MSKILSWNEKTFEVTNDKIYTFRGWSTSSSYEVDEKENGKEMPKDTAKAPGIGSISFEVYLRSDLGMDVKAEYDWWRAECNKGTTSLLYIGDEQFGKYRWRLTGVSQSELKLANGGKWQSCKMSLTFGESYYKVKQTKLEKKAAKLAKKLAKATKQAEKAKSKKALAKAAKKAAKLKKQMEETLIKAAEKKAAALQAQVEARKKAADEIQRYYSDLS